ncbi:hypothetical protein [Limnohabitans sp.]|jgi:hypothetical protein|uniref:hypothetical protein n=1 Tax=Limnohabitans sp. TaxID=1907725 RepID=UPI0037BED6BF
MKSLERPLHKWRSRKLGGNALQTGTPLVFETNAKWAILSVRACQFVGQWQGTLLAKGHPFGVGSLKAQGTAMHHAKMAAR